MDIWDQCRLNGWLDIFSLTFAECSCFDYGNAETNNRDDGVGTMEAVYFGSSSDALAHHGPGRGPWVMADLENGVWSGNNTENPQNTPILASEMDPG